MLKTRELLDQLGSTEAGAQTQHPMAKMQIVVDYIATHLEGGEQDEQRLYEIIYAAKKNIAETIINVREAQGLVEDNVNLHSPASGIDNETGNIMTSMFLLAPETIVKTMTEGQLEGEPQPQANGQDKPADYQAAFNLLRGKEKSYSAYEGGCSEGLNDIFNLADNFSEFQGEDPVAEAKAECDKKGFFEGLFRTTSNEYKNFRRLLDARQHGGATREELDDAAKAYLIRKIPGYTGEGLPSIEDINSIPGRGRNRAVLCYKTLLATKQSREYERKVNALYNVAEKNLKACGQDRTLAQLKVENSAPFANANEPQQQAQFQNDLSNDINEIKPFDKVIADDNNIINNEPKLDDDMIK